MTQVPLSSPPDRPRSRSAVPLVLSVVLAGLLALAFWPGSGGSTQVDVPEGATGHAVARQLLDAHVLQTRYPLLLWIRVRNAAQKIHAGRYRFPSGRSAFWIV